METTLIIYKKYDNGNFKLLYHGLSMDIDYNGTTSHITINYINKNNYPTYVSYIINGKFTILHALYVISKKQHD